jgi:membrane-anchored mycosin MYCP
LVPAGSARCAAPVAGSVSADIPWPQRRYDFAGLWQITDGAGVTVAVIDSGVDAAGPQLAGAVLAGADLLVPGGTGREDCKAHGTAVASIIAARPVGGSGLRGLAPAAKILPVRVSERVAPTGADTATEPGAGDIADLVAGIRFATTARPKPAVINLSISTTTDNPGLRSAVREAIAADIVLVAAVGNEHERGDPRPYPASYEGVIGVGAVGPDSLRVASSTVGSYVDIVAPGSQVVGALPGGGHAAYEGTSFATPFVSATAALIRARWPQLHQAEVVRRLLATVDPVPAGQPSPDYGYGLLNPFRALTELVPPVDASPAARAGIPAARARSSTPEGSIGPALSAASILVLAAAGITLVAAAVPAGRRRRWRPPPST